MKRDKFIFQALFKESKRNVGTMSGPTLIFQPYGKRLEITGQKNLLEAAREAGIVISSICGGQGVCGKCRVIIRNGQENLSSLSGSETLFLPKEDVDEGFRLACQATVKTDGIIVVEVPYESQVDRQRLLLKGLEKEVELKPAVRKFTVHLEKPSLLDVKSDADRLVDAAASKTGWKPRVDYETLKQLPHVLREGDWATTVTLWEDSEVISVEADASRGLYGFAVDIGTTKLAGYLLDLRSGKVVATASRMNPQIVYGEDVISRISFAMREEGNLKTLQEAVVEGVNWLVSEACGSAHVSADEVYDMTVAGNTAMHHIFLGIPPNYIALLPYTAALQSPIDVKARDLGVKINRGAYVHLLPTIAGFVGGDAVADALATEIYEADEISMMIDIGTNTEIILGNKDRLLSCSCASGPALEGAHIRYGMRATTGAIEHVWVDPKTFDVKYRTIEDEKPRGLCGSAIVDIVAELLKAGIIDHSGKFSTETKTPRLRMGEKFAEFVVSWKDEAAVGSDIVMTQADIREVQLAKAAIYTGASILMKHMKIAPQDIKKIFLAGAFGNYIDPQSARVIGMYPDVPLERVQFVGNTAGSGARMTLLSVDVRKKTKDIANQIKYLELGADPNFQNEFFKATYLPHREMERFPRVAGLLKNRAKN
jgi:uncharacterized 2Fe-2S/4Fe-4S cluster protein (DUF4445 family)